MYLSFSLCAVIISTDRIHLVYVVACRKVIELQHYSGRNIYGSDHTAGVQVLTSGLSHGSSPDANFAGTLQLVRQRQSWVSDLHAASQLQLRPCRVKVTKAPRGRGGRGGGVARSRCHLKRHLFIVAKHVFISCPHRLWLRAEPSRSL